MALKFSWSGALNAYKAIEAKNLAEEERLDNIRLRREDALLSLYLKNGGTYGSTKNDPKYRAAGEQALILQKRVNGEDLDTDTVKWYQNILQDPIAAAEVNDFLATQEKDFDRVIPLQDVPKYINIINTPNMPVEEKIDLFAQLDLVDLTDKEQYYKLAQQIQNMTKKSGRTVFTYQTPGSNIDTSRKLKLAEDQYSTMIELLVPTAQTWLEMNPDPANQQAVETQNAIQNLDSPEEAVRAKAQKYLFETYTTQDFVTRLEKSQPEYFRDLSKVPQVKILLESQKPFAAPTPEDTQLLKSNPSEEMKRKFDEIYGPGAADRVLNG